MAGIYADVPGVRIPYHVDGSLVRWATTVSNSNRTISSAWTAYSAADAAEMNDGDTTDVLMVSCNAYAGRMIAFIFPQPVTILGHNLLFYYSGGVDHVFDLSYSTDTTDGGDGTWNITPHNMDTTTGSALRQMTAVNFPSVRGMRLWMTNGYSGTANYYARDMAFYGSWTPATLAGWHPTSDIQVPPAQLDFGDIATGTQATKQFRIKNGRSLTANNVVVSAAAGNVQTAGGMSLSTDNVTFTPTVTIASIAPGAISPIVYVKRTVGSGEMVGNIGIATVQFIAGSWT
jgi:hypothetical protein